ncbi:hypothetical protein M0R45_021258 [Rubus argutus]|uniref:Mediator of RNA polymerase II transcription subunit 21 n=1 Tax=Rubus argutus TaxID=59490 RepID=A0AAW1XD54_RUBAR
MDEALIRRHRLIICAGNAALIGRPYRLTICALDFDALVAALPLSEGGEEAQLKRIAELQAENSVVGRELEKQLEAAERELEEVRELFGQAADHCLNLKKPE